MPTSFAEEGQPSRFIMAWSGQLTDIPTGWALCDGNNGTPNLLDRFIIGASGSSSSVGSTVGSHTMSLTSRYLPEHTHTGESASGGSHTHEMYVSNTDASGTNAGRWSDVNTGSSNGPELNSAGSHSHPVTNLADSGSGQSFDRRPQYYELAFIAPI